MISLSHVYKSFEVGTVNETRLFEDFSFTVPRGEFLSIVGSNGSGKTTFLNLVSGALFPDSGKIFLDGEDVTAQKEHCRASRIGRVFQDPANGVAGRMTIAENMALAHNKGCRYGLRAGLSRPLFAALQEEVATLGLGLENKMNVPIGTLSGGQRQAVSLLMATMTPLDVLILDEHTAALDPKTADLIMEITDRIVKEKQITALMVTHNLRYAVEYGTRTAMFHAGKVVFDCAGEKKKALKVEDILSLFNQISVECGN